jgi:DNA-binding XRE family transcriptional regulator
MIVTREEDFQTQLGDEIRRLRTEKGWSQEQLGEKVGIHRNSVARYEAGADIPVMLFVRMCVALGTHGKDVLDRVLPDAGKRIAAANGLTKEKTK